MQPSSEGDTLVVDAHVTAARLLADHVRMQCERAGVDPAAAFDLELAVVEAANNVIEHGYAGQSGGTIGLTVAIGGGEARVTLCDRGAAVPNGFFGDGTMPDPLATGGRGSFLILACVDTVDYGSEGGENRLLLCKRLRSCPA